MIVPLRHDEMILLSLCAIKAFPVQSLVQD